MICVLHHQHSARMTSQPSTGEPEQNSDHVVHFGAGIIEGEGRAHRSFQSKTAEDGLRTVVASAHGNPLLVEGCSDLFGREAIQNEGEYARLICSRPDET